MITELCIDVITTFSNLKQQLQIATTCICEVDKDLPAWFQLPPMLPVMPNSTTRQQASALIMQLEYLDAQQPREILVGAGLIAASQTTLDAIDQLNQAKSAFKQAMLRLRAAKVAPSHELLISNFEKILPQRDLELATKLARMGLARIHLKQCYRKIPYFTQRPLKVSWTWANTRSIKKISVAEALQLLNKQFRDPGIEQQIRKLQGLDPSEPLAIIQDLAPHLRANIVLPNGNDNKRLMVKGPVPIFYLDTENIDLPEFVPAGIKRGKDKDRSIRKDVKINPDPFLPAIRAHRYYAEAVTD